MGPNAPGIAGCLQDCMDAHPNWTVARCKASCRDPGVPKVAVAGYNGISRQRRYVGTAIFFVNRPRETYSWRVSAFCPPGWEVEAPAPAPRSETNVWRVEESGKCGIISVSGEDVAWDEAWESLWARE
jgi:hypothetical protein